MGHKAIFASIGYLFFSLILIQNTVELALISINVPLPVSALSAIKYAVLAGMCGFILTTKSTYTLSNTEKLALALSLVLILLGAVKGGGSSYIADEFRFYFAPIGLFLLGRTACPFKSEKDMAAFIMTIGILYVVLGSIYVVIDKQTLVDGGMRDLLQQKLSDIGRSDAVRNGLPINFYYFHNTGAVSNRAFGALYDPLASAFFGAPLFFYLYEAHRRKAARAAGVLAVAVAVLIVLSFTRSIIAGIVIVLLASLIHKKGIAALPIWAIFVAALAVGAFLLTHLETILDPLDPSTQAHLKAYLQLDLKSSLIGSLFDSGTPRGAESLYLTIFLECGLGGLLFYLAWISHLYRNLQRRIAAPYARATLESMFVYLLASFTTEHWFIFTSGSLFWFLIGNTLSWAEDHEAKTVAEQAQSNAVLFSPPLGASS